MSAKRHEHTFTALWTHFGEYYGAEETVHYHVCFDDACDRVLVGQGHSCDGDTGTHVRKTLVSA